ncbi:MAG: hypothetical protein PVG84_14200, partial [Desulfobacterales bacterium]
IKVFNSLSQRGGLADKATCCFGAVKMINRLSEFCLVVRLHFIVCFNGCKREKNKSRVRRLTAGAFRILLELVILRFLLVLILRWIPPPTSMMMILRRDEAEMNHRKCFRID